MERIENARSAEMTHAWMGMGARTQIRWAVEWFGLAWDWDSYCHSDIGVRIFWWCSARCSTFDGRGSKTPLIAALPKMFFVAVILPELSAIGLPYTQIQAELTPASSGTAGIQAAAANPATSSREETGRD